MLEQEALNERQLAIQAAYYALKAYVDQFGNIYPDPLINEEMVRLCYVYANIDPESDKDRHNVPPPPPPPED